MEYVVIWLLTGYALLRYGNAISNDPIRSVGLTIGCTLFGPITLLLVIEQWSHNKWLTGMPWFLQGPKMRKLIKKCRKASKYRKERLLEQHTVRQKYVVHFKTGEPSIAAIYWAEPVLHKTSYPKYWTVRVYDRKQVKQQILDKLKEEGFTVGEQVYPWHEISCVQFSI